MSGTWYMSGPESSGPLRNQTEAALFLAHRVPKKCVLVFDFAVSVLTYQEQRPAVRGVRY
eukprot:211495-Rhodomonas_salina.2